MAGTSGVVAKKWSLSLLRAEHVVGDAANPAEARTEGSSTVTVNCSHLDSIRFLELPDSIAGCEDCSRAAVGGCTCACATRVGISAAATTHRASTPQPTPAMPATPSSRRAWRGLELLLRGRHRICHQPMTSAQSKIIRNQERRCPTPPLLIMQSYP